MKELMKGLKDLTGEKSLLQIFTDWVTVFALAISNTVDKCNKEEREKQYLRITQNYTSAELTAFSSLFAKLVALCDNFVSQGQGFRDVLGEVYTRLGLNNASLGQFYTPYDVCKLIAKLESYECDGNGIFTISDCAVGSGALVISFCEELIMEKGIKQSQIRVVAQDVSYLACCMAYIQLSLYGIPAIVIVGDSLRNPYNGGFGENTFVSPLYYAVEKNVA